ncbi:hypothetical protein [Hansschlegelia zhihuaiae]|uniref:NlpC/P60 domain-containing protein n=1 Tax=Hansschlegelia zhihuaiae TaxID=405005 RepID=A0A4Q0MPT6_9HYPH|nr:hypothetical protein [Hansschlegelia zhihuaiae]RXF75086.1 hypothetical protein EK403_03290 [Hansschlegelia zhihuaiae]
MIAPAAPAAAIAEAFTNRFVSAEIGWLEDDRGWAGTHCFGLVRLVLLEDHGIFVPDYGPARDRHERLRDGAARTPFRPVSKAVQNPVERRPYDVVTFDAAGFDDHCGIVATPRLMLHLSKRVGYARVDRIDIGWGAVSGVFRHESLL